MRIRVLRAHHSVIILRASELGGLSERIKVRDDAVEAQQRIDAIDGLMVEHLTIEDDWLYPTLMASQDPAVRRLATEAQEEMGGVLGAWTSYRDHWDADEIVKHPKRFAAATAGIVGALALRVDRENNELYPAMERLEAEPGSGEPVAGPEASRRGD